MAEKSRGDNFLAYRRRKRRPIGAWGCSRHNYNVPVTLGLIETWLAHDHGSIVRDNDGRESAQVVDLWGLNDSVLPSGNRGFLGRSSYLVSEALVRRLS